MRRYWQLSLTTINGMSWGHHLTITACVSCSQPVITPAEAGLSLRETQVDEERALCLYVRSIIDERVPASRCFSTLSPFPPPPPPLPQSVLARIQTTLRRRKVRQGGSAGSERAPQEADETAFVRQHAAKHAEVEGLLDRLSNENFQLRAVLDGIRPKLANGRRLFERLAGTASHDFALNVKHSALSVGNGALSGLTIAECSTLCAALQNETDSLDSCRGIAYRMLQPANPSNLQTAFCFLLNTIGSCSTADFAAAIFLRRDTSGCRSPTAQDNPMCVQLSTDQGAEARVLNYANAKASCRNGKRLPMLPRPRSSLEAFSTVAYARERGVAAFWAQKPIPGAARQATHWSGLDGKPFFYPGGNDDRCVLVATQSENVHGHMFARMEPCNRAMADGVVCESGMAAP